MQLHHREGAAAIPACASRPAAPEPFQDQRRACWYLVDRRHWLAGVAQPGETSGDLIKRMSANMTEVTVTAPSEHGYTPGTWSSAMLRAVHRPELTTVLPQAEAAIHHQRHSPPENP